MIPRFYACIIGSEILNGRRQDGHFSFLLQRLQTLGLSLYATFIIPDDPSFIKHIFQLVYNDPQSVMFCFGGIGATPDDYTRQVSADVFSNGVLKRHEEAQRRIVERFGDEAYPYRVLMADLPSESQLLDNPINNVAGYYLYERFFFVPGFPQMAHPMVESVIEKFFSHFNLSILRLSWTIQSSENELIPLMNLLTQEEITLSSLPILLTRCVVLSVEVLKHDGERIEYLIDEWLEEHHYNFSKGDSLSPLKN